MHPNRRAFLDMIAVSEGTSTHPLTVHDGYDVIVTGADKKPEVFTDFSAHPFAPEHPANNGVRRPSKLITKAGLLSTASGRYQFMYDNPGTRALEWPHYRDTLGLPDFGPESQDKWALQLIRERGALPLIDAGEFALAVTRCRNIWASFPGAGYGQPEHDLNKLKVAFIKAGGQLA